MVVSFPGYEQLEFVNTEFHLIHLKSNVTYLGLCSSFFHDSNTYGVYLISSAEIKSGDSGSQITNCFLCYELKTRSL